MGYLGSVFVTTDSGLLGPFVVKALLASNNASHITVFDDSTSPTRIDNPQVSYVTGSVTSREALRTALQSSKAEVIIHTVSPDGFASTPKILEDVNVRGTENIIACAVECGVKALVYTSSSGVVQRSYETMLNVDETAPLADVCMDGTAYGRTKQIAEGLVLQANGKRGLHTAVLRPATTFGEGDKDMVTQAVQMGTDGSVRYCIGNGKNMYDYIYVGNSADAHILAAKKLLEEARSTTPISEDMRVSGEAFFISNDDPLPFWEFLTSVAREMDKPVADGEIWHIPLGVVTFVLGIVEWLTWMVTLGGRPGITRGMVKFTAQIRTFDISKAKKRLGYRPRVGMEEGIRRAVEWHLSHSPNTKKVE